jgi:hypothetical protein
VEANLLKYEKIKLLSRAVGRRALVSVYLNTTTNTSSKTTTTNNNKNNIIIIIITNSNNTTNITFISVNRLVTGKILLQRRYCIYNFGKL